VKRFIVLALALTMLAALSALPASATHEAMPITITAQSTYAGLCGAKPGPDRQPPASWNTSLNANAALGAGAVIPADLWKDGSTPLGGVSGPCTYGTDSLWNITGQVGIRGSAGCNNVTRSEGPCRGLHYPGAGPPVQPGRFLNFAENSPSPDPKNVCLFVTTLAPNQGTCASLGVGYTFAVGDAANEIEGSYCGTSRGFTWIMTTPTPSSFPTTWTVLEWTPSSAGSLLPVTGVIAGPNWATNLHYKGWEGVAGKPSMRFKAGTIQNIFALTSARSYIANVDNESTTPGSCGNPLENGGVQFFNQGVAVGIGDAT
jgi:hypothetical protein